MRRVLQLVGITDRPGRDRLDEQVLQLTQSISERAEAGGVKVDGVNGDAAGDDEDAAAIEGVEVAGARNDDGVLALSIRADGVTPAHLFAATLRHGNTELERLIEAMDREVAPATATVLTGGWASMRSVQRARSLVLPAITVSPRAQETAYGAATLAAQLLSIAPADPADDHVTGRSRSPRTHAAQPGAGDDAPAPPLDPDRLIPTT